MKRLFLSNVPCSVGMSFAALSIAAVAVSLAGCGDEITEVKFTGVEVLAAGETRGDCTKDNIGEMVFVTDSNAVFICADGKWQTLNGADGENGKNGKDGLSCKVSQSADHSETTVTCETADGDPISYVVKNGEDGKDGENGKDGEDGKDGQSCSVSQNADHTETTITCETADGKSVSYVVKNGSSCGITEGENGVVKLTCGEDGDTTKIYKAMCGIEPYDPEKALCFEGKLYSCGEKPYDPESQYCLELPSGTKQMEAYLFDSRDAENPRKYKTVAIGSQVWMAENLNFNVEERSWCAGGNCSVYGRLYTWDAAVGKSENECGEGQKCGLSGTVQGICPEGWHLPNNEDWKTLLEPIANKVINSSEVVYYHGAGLKLKTVSGWIKDGGNGIDAYGFSAFPAGEREQGNIGGFGYYAAFWSSAENDDARANRVFLSVTEDIARLGPAQKSVGYSVRCLKN